MLNARQKAFCEYYVASGNATESARRAGYSENYATNRIHELMKNVGICGYIEELNNKIKIILIMIQILIQRIGIKSEQFRRQIAFSRIR